MNATELLSYQMDKVGKQVLKSVEGLSPEHTDTKISKKSMSARQTLIHLAEVSQAIIEEAAGRTHEWGTFPHYKASYSEAMNLYTELRAQAVAAVLASPTDALVQSAAGFICLHESYHVGQLALIRMECEPEWDAFSIYK